jgi:hypothetical protein
MLQGVSVALVLVVLAMAVRTDDASAGNVLKLDTQRGAITTQPSVIVAPKVSCRVEFDGGWGELEIKNLGLAPIAKNTKFSWKTNTGKAGVTKGLGYALPPGNEAYFPSVFQRQQGDPDKTCTAKAA